MRSRNHWRQRWGYGYWSLSAWAKLRVKNAVNFIGAFEDALAYEARRVGADGVICGHIHHAALRTLRSITYANCGDWVESCSALVEHFDGRLEILHWRDWSANLAPERSEGENAPGDDEDPAVATFPLPAILSGARAS